MKFLSIFFREPSDRNTSSAKLNAKHEAQDAAYWRGEYESALIKLDNQRAALADIRNQGINSASGTARAMARKAGEALS